MQTRTGALTNAALLLTLFPEAAEEIEQIVLMGGAIGSGNTNPCAEFNLQASYNVLLFSHFPRISSGMRGFNMRPDL